MSEFSPEEWAAKIQQAEQSVPQICELSTVAVLRLSGSATIPLGTGTLYKIADQAFVVTAAHSIRNAQYAGSGLAVTRACSKIVETPARWVCSPLDANEPDKGLGDIAVYPLSNSQENELDGKKFTRLADLSLGHDQGIGLFRFVGFPQMFCEMSTVADEKVYLGMLIFATTVNQRTVSLSEYDAQVHILLDGSDENLVDHSGARTRLRARQAVLVKLIDGLPGISGCGVWRIGGRNNPVERWTQEDAGLVGVAIASYPKSEVIKVTRWKFVNKLIYAAFPEMRGALDLLTLVR